MMKLAIATCRVLPEPDHDQSLLLAALTRAGIKAKMLAWDDPSATLDGADMCVIRSTWNYHLDRPGFLAWAKRIDAQTRLYNPLPVLTANSHKTYLRTLVQRGIPIVPTHFLDAGASNRLTDIMAEHKWQDVVVKPAVSAASYRTGRFSSKTVEEGNRFLADLLRDREALIQPYMRSVESTGERALIWVDGELTHAVQKVPRFAGHDEHVSQALAINDDERRFAASALATIEDELLYARVDVVRTEDGSLAVMELELVEPSLYLAQCPAALERLVEGIRKRLA